MNTQRRAFLRKIMNLAWGLFRADRARGFADALRGAWKFLRQPVELPRWARKGGRVRFSSLVYSPMDRTRGGDFASTRDRSAIVTSKIGR